MQEIDRPSGGLRRYLPGYEPTPAYLRALLSHQTHIQHSSKDDSDSLSALQGAIHGELDMSEREMFKVALTSLMRDVHKEVLRRPFNIDSGFLARLVLAHQLLPEDIRASNGTQILVRWTQEPALKGIDDSWWGNLHFHTVDTAFLTGGTIPEEVLEHDLYDDRFDITAIMIATQQSLPRGAELFARWIDHRLKIANIPVEDITGKFAVAFLPTTIEERHGSGAFRTFLANIAGRLRLPEIPENLEELITAYKNTDFTIDWNPREREARRVSKFSEQALANWIYESLRNDDYHPKGGSTIGYVRDIYRLLGAPRQETMRNLIIDDLSEIASNPHSAWKGYALDHLLLLSVDILIEHGQAREKAVPHLLKIVENPDFIPIGPQDLNKWWNSFDFHLRTMQTLIGLGYFPDDPDFWKRQYHAVPSYRRHEEGYINLVGCALASYGLPTALEWVAEVSDKKSLVFNIEEAIRETALEDDSDAEERAKALEKILPQLPVGLRFRVEKTVASIEKDLTKS